MKHRWPRSIHSQISAIFNSIRAIRKTKEEAPRGIRSFNAWELYLREGHKFAKFLLSRGFSNLLDTMSVRENMREYLQEKLIYNVENEGSRQTLETLIAALGKFEYALNNYIQQRSLDVIPLDTEKIRRDYYAKGKEFLKISSRKFDSRSYPDPVALIQNIEGGTFQLQACLQFEGGLRAQGVGAPRNQRLLNPLTRKGLHGIVPDPVTGKSVGCVSSIEKGGKETRHFISAETYHRLEKYMDIYGQLESDYAKYVEAINDAARKTGQFFPGRGSHGLKHCFAKRRYAECVMCGLSHEQALQQTSLETSHFRLAETLTYTRGPRR